MDTGQCNFTRYYKNKLNFILDKDSESSLNKECEYFAKFLTTNFKPKSIIEFSCGKGIFLSQFKKLGVNILGLESNQYFIDKASSEVKKYILSADYGFKNLSLNSDKKFDLAIALNIVDAFSEEDALNFINFLCTVSDNIIFSFSCDVNDTGCFNLNQIEYWSSKFSANGFFRDLTFKPCFNSRESEKFQSDLPNQNYNVVRFTRQNVSKEKIIESYERNIRLLNDYYGKNLSLINDSEVKKFISTQKEKISELKNSLRKLESEKKQILSTLKKNKDEIKALVADREALECRLNSELNELQHIKSSAWWKLGSPWRGIYTSSNSAIKKMHQETYDEEKDKDDLQHILNNLFLGKSLNVSDFIDPKLAINQIKANFKNDIKFSILVPLYNTKKLYLNQMIDSVLNQTYKNWELCLADASDLKHDYVREICEAYSKKFPNIKYKKLFKNKGISENTNEAIKIATGNFISLLDHDDILHPSALFESARAIIEQKADFTYTDETKFELDVKVTFDNHLKPDFSIDNLRSNNYICHFSSFSRELLDKVGYFNSKFDGSQDHDLMLRLSEHAKNIVHIPYVLYYWRCHKESVASDIGAKNYAIEAGIEAVKAHLQRLNIEAEVSNVPKFGAIYSVKYAFKENPRVSIIIPSLGNAKSLKRCIESINRLTSYKNYEIIAVVKDIIPKNQVIFRDEVSKYVNLDLANIVSDPNEKQQQKLKLKSHQIQKEIFYQNIQTYKEIQSIDNVKLVYWDEAFNYSSMSNYGVKLASGKCCVFLSDNAVVGNDCWLESMLGFLSRNEVAVVGAKILYQFDKIKSTGLTLSKLAFLRNLHEGLPAESPGYFGRAVYPNNCLAVSNICMAVKKEEFLEINGFSPDLPVLFSDADLCLRFREKNKLIVYDPRSEVYYSDFISDTFNKLDDAGINEEKQKDLFMCKWKSVIEKYDPYYNRNLRQDGPTFVENINVKYGKENLN